MEKQNIEAFVVLNEGSVMASYNVELGFEKALFYAKSNANKYGGAVLVRDRIGNLVAVDYKELAKA